MDRNFILAVALSMAVLSLYTFYQGSVRPPLANNAVQQEEQAPADSSASTNTVDDARVKGARQDEALPLESAVSPPEVESVVPWTGVFKGQEFEAELTNRGAALTRWTLLQFSELDRTGKKGAAIELVNHGEDDPGALAMPFEELGLGDLSRARYSVESTTSDRAVFVLVRDGVEIRKTYQFDPDGYGLDLVVEVRNHTAEPIQPDFSLRWPAVVRHGNDYTEESLIVRHAQSVEKKPVASVGVAGFFDGIFGRKHEDVIWSDVEWAGVDLKYFLSVVLPDPVEGTRAVFEPLEPKHSAETVVRFSAVEIAPGQSLRRHLRGFLGPKEPDLLASVGSDLSRSIDLGYSWFEPLTLFFRWLLNAAYRIVPNYGWSIILITILVRLLTLPIMNRQMRSMERMRALQPRLKEIQAQFSDDRQKQSEATMALYKESGVNPLGGCFPMLLQFPVFIGLFYALKSSFALRQAPFLLWINDLSAPESLFVIPGLDIPFRVLPLIMGASMILQQKLTPTTVDPSQQVMMMFMMPIMMTVLFYQFPSGLVLYWMVSNFLGIAHQMLVGRAMTAAKA